ncbi:MAG: hypothetical protein DRJ42_06105 [Deltaproteobacteria bacterium]|nr:MAG: hypothetical protein DRJ42_06105 [Deltaproteobacteria bacterium]
MPDDDTIGGPLGEMLSELPQLPNQRGPAAAGPGEAVHTRVLPVETAEGSELVLACWRDPGGAAALHAALRLRIEGSLIGELSRTADDLRENPSALVGLRLVLFADVADAGDAVKAFGLSRAGAGTAESRAALARLRHEATLFGESIPDEPVAIYAGRAVVTDIAREVESALVEMTGDVWGKNPGAPFARMARAFAAIEDARLSADASADTRVVLSADLAGVSAVEELLFTDRPGVLRWLPPLTFQALCDLLAVAISRSLGRQVDWAETAADDAGVAPPPMIRLSGNVHVPLALEVLRWAVMPRRVDEEVPSLSEWLSGTFS